MQEEQNPPVYHRDIKPSNIMWHKRQIYKLIDFNISTTTDDKSFGGTFPYMAPDLVMSGNKIDKYKAKKAKWRISEATLLLLAILGGSIGAWIGMKIWHHKTMHKKFKYGVPAILLIQIAAMIYLHMNL